jgi:hypothetical protein
MPVAAICATVVADLVGALDGKKKEEACGQAGILGK